MRAFQDGSLLGINFLAGGDVDSCFLIEQIFQNLARFLTDGIVRARYRNGADKPAEVVPGRVYKYTIDLWATGNER